MIRDCCASLWTTFHCLSSALRPRTRTGWTLSEVRSFERPCDAKASTLSPRHLMAPGQKGPRALLSSFQTE